MARTRHLAVALTAAALLTAAAQAAAGERSPDPRAVRAAATDSMLAEVNTARRRAGAVPVRASPRLGRAARRWAQRLARRGVLAHSSWSAGGEVIEWHTGRRPEVGETVRRWLASAGHRTVLLDRGWRRAGAGRAVGHVRGRPVTIWVVRLARG